MTLAEYLRTFDLTHSAFAEKIGVTQVAVHRWIKGTRFPDREMILRIEDVTSGAVRPADWFTREHPDIFGPAPDAPAATHEPANPVSEPEVAE